MGGTDMSKAGDRRRKRRHKYMRELAEQSPMQFKREWSKRLESWEELAKIRAARLGRFMGIEVRPAFELVDHAMRELQAIGDVAVELEGEATRQMLLGECTKAVAKQVDPRLSRLGYDYSRNR
jgi:hypothetical protein